MNDLQSPPTAIKTAADGISLEHIGCGGNITSISLAQGATSTARDLMEGTKSEPSRSITLFTCQKCGHRETR